MFGVRPTASVWLCPGGRICGTGWAHTVSAAGQGSRHGTCLLPPEAQGYMDHTLFSCGAHRRWAACGWIRMNGTECVLECMLYTFISSAPAYTVGIAPCTALLLEEAAALDFRCMYHTTGCNEKHGKKAANIPEPHFQKISLTYFSIGAILLCSFNQNRGVIWNPNATISWMR